MTVITPEHYFERIKSLHNPEDIQQLCDELTASLFKPTHKDKTRVNKLIPYNKLIGEGFSNDDLKEGENAYIQQRSDGSFWKRHLHFKYVGIADVNWNGEGGINHKTIVLDRLENQKEIDVNKYLDITSQLLLSEDSHELAVGLIAASGRRPIEILARGDFFVCSELPEYLQSGYFLDFRGQAKKRDYDVSEEEKLEYRIGVLVPSDFFLDAFTRFRQTDESKEIFKLLNEETKKGTDAETINDAIESRRGNSLRRVVAKAYGEFLPKRHGDNDVNNKALRAVYVALVTKRDCPKHINNLLWAGRAVGHFVDRTDVSDRDLIHLVTTLGYSDYVVNSEVPFISVPQMPEKEKALPVRIFASDFEVIKEWQNEWELKSQQLAVHNIIEQAQKVKELEKKLFEAQEQIIKLQKEKEDMEVRVVTPNEVEASTEDRLQPMVEKIVADALQKMLPEYLKNMSNQSEPKTIDKSVSSDQDTTEQNNHKTLQSEASDKDWESIPSEELRKTKGKGSSNEKIRRAFQAIVNHNDNKAKDNNGNSDINQMWVIGNQPLRQLSGCNGQIVTDWILQHRLALEDHNNKYGLGQYHNKRHKQAITEVISW